MNQPPLAHLENTATRPVIARLLEVEAWREQYLDHVRELATVELDWAKLGGRVNAWKNLIIEDVELDPFLSGEERFLGSLDGPQDSLKANAGQRRRFLMNHEQLKDRSPADPES